MNATNTRNYSPAVFITGSGKCGSSIVAHSFFRAGFPMGTEEELVLHRGAKGNIGGYWEHSGILRMNQDILASNNAAWDKMPRLPLTLSPELRARMRLLAESLPLEFCCKDPRLVWTLDLWTEWFPNVVLVAPFRNPVGFVKSIAFKWPEQFTADSTLQDARSTELSIWEGSNRRLLKLSQAIPTWWVCFDDPVDTFKHRLASIIATFGRSLDSLAFDAFFVPSERRFSSPEDLELTMSFVPDSIRDLYETIRKLSRSPPVPLFADRL